MPANYLNAFNVQGPDAAPLTRAISNIPNQARANQNMLMRQEQLQVDNQRAGQRMNLLQGQDARAGKRLDFDIRNADRETQQKFMELSGKLWASDTDPNKANAIAAIEQYTGEAFDDDDRQSIEGYANVFKPKEEKPLSPAGKRAYDAKHGWLGGDTNAQADPLIKLFGEEGPYKDIAPEARKSAEMLLSMGRDKEAFKLLERARLKEPQFLADQIKAKKKAERLAGLQMDKPTAERAANTFIRGAKRIGDAATALYNHPGLDAATGPVDAKFPTLVEDTANFETELDTLTTQIFVDAIAEMRSLSKSGGALGSVTEREIELMKNSKANLRLRQGQGNMRKNLIKLVRQYNSSMEAVSVEYEKRFGVKMPWDRLPLPAKKDADGYSAVRAK